MVYKTLHRKLKIEQHELMAKRKRTNNGLQNITQKTKDRTRQTIISFLCNVL
jgi:hypothetical protein